MKSDDANAATVLNAIRAAARGEAILHPRIAQRLMAEVSAPKETQNPAAKLTEREMEVLQLIAQGLVGVHLTVVKRPTGQPGT